MVRATDPKGTPLGENNGTSNVSVFKSGDNINIEIDSLNVSCCVNGHQNVYLKVNNLHLTNAASIVSIQYRINGTGPLTSLTPVTPGLPHTISAGNSQIFTGSLSCSDSMKTIKFIVGAAWPSDPDNINNETAWDTLSCPCDPCRNIGVSVVQDALQTPKNGNPVQINLVGSFIGLNANTIKKVTAEIIYFNITQTNDPNCAKCVYDSRYYGNFYPPSSALPGYGGPVLNRPDYSRLITWTSTIIKACGQDNSGGNGTKNEIYGSPQIPEAFNQKSIQNDKTNPLQTTNLQSEFKPPHFILPIAVPELNSLSCCGDKINICVRYTFYDFCCHACEVIRCYEIQRGK
jgi:hypothetical protein